MVKRQLIKSGFRCSKYIKQGCFEHGIILRKLHVLLLMLLGLVNNPEECATDALTLEMRAVRQSLTSAGFPGAESLVLLPFSG